MRWLRHRWGVFSSRLERPSKNVRSNDLGVLRVLASALMRWKSTCRSHTCDCALQKCFVSFRNSTLLQSTIYSTLPFYLMHLNLFDETLFLLRKLPFSVVSVDARFFSASVYISVLHPLGLAFHNLYSSKLTVYSLSRWNGWPAGFERGRYIRIHRANYGRGRELSTLKLAKLIQPFTTCDLEPCGASRTVNRS